MITIVAWIVFVFATFWNILYFGVALGQILKEEKTNWQCEIVAIVLSLTLWFVPGVYLFGWF